MGRFYDMIEASAIDVDTLTMHHVPLGPMSVGNIAIAAGANVYPITLPANSTGRLIAASELFSNAAWKSTGTVIVPGTPTQRVTIGNIVKSELQGLAAAGNTAAFAFTADLQPFSNANTNSPVTDTPAYSVQLAVSNCAQACNVFLTLA